MKNFLFIITFFLSVYSLMAQDSTSWKLFPPQQQPKNISKKSFIKSEVRPATITPGQGSLEVIQDERIEALLEKDKRIKEEQKTISGYRVQLFSGSGANVREEANKIKADFLKNYDETPSYVFYDQPTWKTRVGDFRTKLEAEQFLMQIQEDFPNSFVVPDDINFPELD